MYMYMYMYTYGWDWSVDYAKVYGRPHIDGLVQERCNSSVLAMELHLSCSKPLI